MGKAQEGQNIEGGIGVGVLGGGDWMPGHITPFFSRLSGNGICGSIF